MYQYMCNWNIYFVEIHLLKTAENHIKTCLIFIYMYKHVCSLIFFCQIRFVHISKCQAIGNEYSSLFLQCTGCCLSFLPGKDRRKKTCIRAIPGYGIPQEEEKGAVKEK